MKILKIGDPRKFHPAKIRAHMVGEGDGEALVLFSSVQILRY